MESKYIEALFQSLIEFNGYLPVRNKEGVIIQNSVIKVLQKVNSSTINIVEIINTDLIEVEQIRQRLDFNMNMLKEHSGAARMNFFEIFVFSIFLDPEKVEAIKYYQYLQRFDGKCLCSFIINLPEDTVTKYPEYIIKDDNIEKVIKNTLTKDLAQVGMKNLDELVAQKTKDYTIELKAKTPVLSYVLMGLNIVVWILLSVYSNINKIDYSRLIIDFGAKENESILLGEYWRFLTPVFLHVNLVHLLVNTYSLYVFGPLVEKIFGHVKFIIIYFTAGIIGNIASFAFSIIPGVGASGAIFGMLGAIVYYGFEKPEAYKRYFGKDILMTIAINIAYGFSSERIDNFAHLGGLLGGFLAAGVLKAGHVKTKYINRITAAVLIMACTAGGLYYGFNNFQNKSILLINQVNQAREKLQEENWEEAERIAEPLLKDYNNNDEKTFDILMIVAIAEASQEKYDEAIEHARTMSNIDPGYGNYVLGICYYYSGQYENAKEAFLEAKKHNDNIEQLDELLESVEKQLK